MGSTDPQSIQVFSQMNTSTFRKLSIEQHCFKDIKMSREKKVEKEMKEEEWWFITSLLHLLPNVTSSHMTIKTAIVATSRFFHTPLQKAPGDTAALHVLSWLELWSKSVS